MIVNFKFRDLIVSHNEGIQKIIPFITFSLSLAALLLEGHDELPGFNILGQTDLPRE